MPIYNKSIKMKDGFAEYYPGLKYLWYLLLTQEIFVEIF